MFHSLSQPINIGKVQLKNRLAVAPTVHNLATEDGCVTERLLEIYKSKGRGGWGLITVEASYLRMDGRNLARMLGVYDDKLVTGLNELAEAIKEEGAKASLQIMHGGCLAAPRFSGSPPMAPSAFSRGSGSGGVALGGLGIGASQPKEMVPMEIEKMIDSYAAAALRVKEAGFDMVTIHGAGVDCIDVSAGGVEGADWFS
ncbi:MAG: hypothetical protein HY730_01410 [Candidatus Tectomicrobia bacterium]|uniref:NADH:flavin oxidoreductase/NADH oxidase N-terminal domain-containing protein n=1 Tax=Tectimicrobiota bacterium TaxID=2528274 RepID=A0A933LPF6_UNCTE|nr:hypothetical protein [Candidatus Tectomicrobia bacterium]